MSTDTDQFTKAALNTFLGFSTAQNLINPHTAAGYKAAVSRILEQVPDTADVRAIDLATEVRRYNNAHPGELSPSSLGQYQRRLEVAIEELTTYNKDPAKYKGRGKSPVDTNGNGKKPEAKQRTKAEPRTAATQLNPPLTQVAGLSYDFPLRSDFLAQVLLPRDLKTSEARRLNQFILTLASDYDAPTS
jgi:hypothetical protein